MSNFLPEGGCYELLIVTSKGFEDLITESNKVQINGRVCDCTKD